MVSNEWGQEIMDPIQSGYLTYPGSTSEGSFNLPERAIILACIHEAKSSRKCHLSFHSVKRRQSWTLLWYTTSPMTSGSPLAREPNQRDVETLTERKELEKKPHVDILLLSRLHFLNETFHSIIYVWLKVFEGVHGIYSTNKSALVTVDTLITFGEQVKFSVALPHRILGIMSF